MTWKRNKVKLPIIYLMCVEQAVEVFRILCVGERGNAVEKSNLDLDLLSQKPSLLSTYAI
jgi:hypothetical protein